jgi:hypothetical protein
MELRRQEIKQMFSTPTADINTSISLITFYARHLFNL